ncbi:MAG: DUF4294 domain-containing protein [Candidatus Competibacteraceae bacterium]|nr:DUF4294 domain-containing protein [Candidatus Competibacteraceae bacterium]
MKNIIFVSIALLLIIVNNAYAQQVTGKNGYTWTQVDTSKTGGELKYYVYSEDTTVVQYLPQFEILTLRHFTKKRDQRKYDRLVRNVKKVYPFAKLAGERMKAYAMVMETMSRKERRNLVRSFEEEIQKTHGQDLRKLTPGQGRILLRLIDRETENTSYELIKDLRGAFAAIFWNAAASMFGFDLKSEFSPITNEEDLYIDEICRMIDAGLL